MNAIGILYLQYWLKFHVKDMFQKHSTLLKVQFCFERFIGVETDRVKIPAFLDENNLDLLIYLIKISMQSNHGDALEPPLVCNRVT